MRPEPRVEAIQRGNLSDELITALRRMIMDGRLAAGERLNEVQLAGELGVSRTPLREALGRLTAEGAVDTVPRIGFFVRPLTVEELRQIYPMRAILDPAALRLVGVPTSARLDRAEELNGELAAATDPESALVADDAWHLELLADCSNGVLLDPIRQFMWKTRRYELAFLREHRAVATATDDHRQIVAALRAGDLDAACSRLQANLERGLDAIARWLGERGRQASAGAARAGGGPGADTGGTPK